MELQDNDRRDFISWRHGFGKSSATSECAGKRPLDREEDQTTLRQVHGSLERRRDTHISRWNTWHIGLDYFYFTRHTFERKRKLVHFCTSTLYERTFSRHKSREKEIRLFDLSIFIWSFVSPSSPRPGHIPQISKEIREREQACVRSVRADKASLSCLTKGTLTSDRTTHVNARRGGSHRLRGRSELWVVASWRLARFPTATHHRAATLSLCSPSSPLPRTEWGGSPPSSPVEIASPPLSRCASFCPLFLSVSSIVRFFFSVLFPLKGITFMLLFQPSGSRWLLLFFFFIANSRGDVCLFSAFFSFAEQKRWQVWLSS